ncbi:Proline iminopeptidase [Zhongshania aliphaticivorans]|uniref:Proline iminopeptidase n=1 Tax=Zhongshania aliphaticivorans TaxID=1470434 RepID=A0A5S9MTK9_9GAMM|nr:prolyl aminopeptidase [Zhongshania aliphaticivorans]CAA0080564.1 Proline iminopeptidase [Zhongshania aliphaticivorans]CAA0085569.1 Proline iminopeptidase [Zhongshania aliphaticivorans]
MILKKRYPPSSSFASYINTESTHQIYAEASGNPHGIPVVFLHGGPGSSCNNNHRRYFDPSRYYIIAYDQRGCGLSTPNGELKNNTSQYLIDDLERIRQHYNIKQWLVFGGSWGACLGLLYAQAHPEQTSGLILRGTFLARGKDLLWFAQHGASELFPSDWKAFTQEIPRNERHDLVTAFYQRLHHGDHSTQLKYAGIWSRWSNKVATHNLTPSGTNRAADDALIRKVKIETHYAHHRYFIVENQILANIDKLPKVPVTIIHGTLDRTCLLSASQQLAAAIPDSELILLDNTGHLIEEEKMISALVNSTDQYIKKLARTARIRTK